MVNQIKKTLRENGYIIILEKEMPYGHRIYLSNGCVILIYPHKYKYCFQGKNVEEISKLLKTML